MAVKGEKRNFTCLWAEYGPNPEELRQILADHEVWLGTSLTPGLESPKSDPPHDLHDILLGWGKLTGINLTLANLRGAFLFKGKLHRSHLNNAKLQNAVLMEANLQGADLRGANLTKANLFFSDFSGVNLRGAILDKANVTGIKYDDKIKALGVRADSCHGNPLFKRFLQDQEYLEAFQMKHPVWYWLWNVFADCGRSFTRWAVWSLGLIYLFAIIYFYGLGEKAFDLSQSSLSFSFNSMLYCSAVVFTALGFGDVKPGCEAAAFWSATEVGLGYVWLGGLISILANKLARRS